MPNASSPMLTALVDGMTRWLARLGFSDGQAVWIEAAVGVLVLVAVNVLLSRLLTRLLTNAVERMAKKTTHKFDDHALARGVPRHVARVVPLLLSYNVIGAFFREMEDAARLVERLFNVLFILFFVRVIRALLRAGRDTLKDSPAFRDKPLDSYVQIASLLMYLFAAILIFSQLTGKSAVTFLTAMGAASAVLLLIFKDTIMGFVASIQISTNDMVRIGDWITMSKYGADGDVTEINLTTVKVANWDRTITTIPTYALIADSFHNWRGMQESGGRRIKRSIPLKMNTMRYLVDAELDKLRGIQLLTSYIDERRAEIAEHNARCGADKSLLINGRNLTNVGLFRKYAELYLAAHPGVHSEMTRMVRQLAPTEKGLPIELYCFTNDIRWAHYEGIMADIFDHLLTATRFFDLEVFESPAADDLRHVGHSLASA